MSSVSSTHRCMLILYIINYADSDSYVHGSIDVLCLLFLYQVFLDEVNTSSCMGLFKEIIIDKTFEGEVRIQHTYLFNTKNTFLAMYHRFPKILTP